MKTLIILILLIALGAGAALSRPSQENFKQFYKQQAEARQTNIFGRLGADLFSDQYVKDCEFKNRIFWITVNHKGQPVYIGAFSHWWGTDAPKK